MEIKPFFEVTGSNGAGSRHDYSPNCGNETQYSNGSLLKSVRASSNQKYNSHY